MIQRGSKLLMAGAVVLAIAGLGGCATRAFVRQNVAAEDEKVGAVGSRVGTVEGRVGVVEGTAREALERARAAGKLAEGKFLYSMVLSDDGVKFAAADAALSPEAQARLNELAAKLKAENRNVYLEIQGHTDATGSEPGNVKLGQDRAEAVRRYLNEHGVALNRMSTISYGPDAPAASNDTKEGRQANRRVVLIVLN